VRSGRRRPRAVGPTGDPDAPGAQPAGSVAEVRLVRGVILTVGLASATMLTTASPAAAHGLGGLRPTNYQTRVLGVRPKAPGLSVRVVDLGTKLELTNSSRVDVVVLGYEGEPYLRVGPAGTFENLRSPAHYLNRTTKGTTHVPASADAHAPPQWHHSGTGRTVRWHDHRAHWMGSSDPPGVQRHPDATQLVQHWTVTLRRAGVTVRVVGDVRWVAGPSPWLWIAASVVLAAAGFAAACTRRWPLALGAATVATILAQLVHTAGGWDSSTSSSWARLAASAYSLGGIALGVAALVILARRGAFSATPFLLFTGIVLLFGGGLGDLTALWYSQLPTTLPAWLDRLTIAVTIGAGIALTAGAGLHLVRSPPRPATRSSAPSPEPRRPPSALRVRYGPRH
jgi:hypothetical protein